MVGNAHAQQRSYRRDRERKECPQCPFADSSLSLSFPVLAAPLLSFLPSFLSFPSPSVPPQSFCFDEQRLRAHETVDMPVFFYLDPAMEEDVRCKDVTHITLSYTFFPVADDDEEEEEQEESEEDKNAAPGSGLRLHGEGGIPLPPGTVVNALGVPVPRATLVDMDSSSSATTTPSSADNKRK